MADGSSRSLPFDRELVVDLFAGGGGASLGIGRAYREPDVAVNHNAIAVAVHRANHPNTRHFTEDVFKVDPLTATGGRPVGLLWASPDCRHHSKAAGGKPRSQRIRGLAWVVVHWALDVAPRVIEMENVEEFMDWCPLGDDDKPIAERRGETFRAFIAAMTTGLAADHPAMAEIAEFLGDRVHVPTLVRGLGYTADWRELRAADYNTPTIRKRLYVKFRRDGVPITWPAPTRAKGGQGGLPAWRTAAECIDFNLPARSIFDRRKPLAANTCKRVAKGLWRYVLACDEPFIVGCGGRMGQSAERGISMPVQTITSKADSCIAQAQWAPFLTEHANATNQRVFPVDEPLRTQVAQVKGGHFSLVAAHVTKFRANSIGSGCDEPLHTVTAGGDMKRPAGAAHALGLVQAHFMEQANGGFYQGEGRSIEAPMSAVLASGSHQQLASAYLVKYYGNERDGVPLFDPMHTIPTKDRMGLVQVVQVPADTLAPELRERAKRCADFLHQYLPEHFTEPADMVLVDGYVLVDITLRMLVPRELARANGFGDDYIIDRGLFETEPGSGQYEWRPVSKTDQVRLIGNAVCSDVAEAIVRHDLAPLIDLYAKVAA